MYIHFILVIVLKPFYRINVFLDRIVTPLTSNKMTEIQSNKTQLNGNYKRSILNQEFPLYTNIHGVPQVTPATGSERNLIGNFILNDIIGQPQLLSTFELTSQMTAGTVLADFNHEEQSLATGIFNPLFSMLSNNLDGFFNRYSFDLTVTISYLAMKQYQGALVLNQYPFTRGLIETSEGKIYSYFDLDTPQITQMMRFKRTILPTMEDFTVSFKLPYINNLNAYRSTVMKPWVNTVRLKGQTGPLSQTNLLTCNTGAQLVVFDPLRVPTDASTPPTINIWGQIDNLRLGGYQPPNAK